MKKMIFLATMIIFGLMFMPNVYAAGSEKPVSSIDSLQNTIDTAGEGDIVKFTMDSGDPVTANTTITINGKDITLDLGGKTLTSSQNITLTVTNSTVNIINGTIDNTNATGIALNIKESTVEVGTNAKVNATYTAINFPEVNSGKNKSSLTIKSGAVVSATNNVGLTVNGLIKDAVSIPEINIKDGAFVKCENDFAIYQAGNSKITIGKATIEGESGIGTKAGNLVLNGTTVKATGAIEEASPRSGGMTSTGATIQMETNNAYNGNIDIEINGGTYTSKSNVVFLEYPKEGVSDASAVSRLHITEGTFQAADGKEVFDVSVPFDKILTKEKSIEGGTFLSGDTPADISSYVKEGLQQDKNGKVINPTSADIVDTPKEDAKNPDTADINLLMLISLITLSGLGLAYAVRKRFN